MKTLFACLSLAAVLTAATTVEAQTRIGEHGGVITTTKTERHGARIETVTCHEFLALHQTVQPKAVSYAIGYDRARKPDMAVFDVTEIDRLTPVIRETCKTTPQLTLLQRIREDLHKL